VEEQDLVRSLNIFISLDILVWQKKNAIAFNSMGTYPIENRFGLTRMWPMDKHT
jgi:hypothetical protein